MRKRRFLYWLLAVMIVLNLLLPAVFASGEDTNPATATELTASTQPPAEDAAKGGEQPEGTDPPKSTDPPADDAAKGGEQTEGTDPPESTDPPADASIEDGEQPEGTEPPKSTDPPADASTEGGEQAEGTEPPKSTDPPADTTTEGGEQAESTEPPSNAPPGDSECKTHSYKNGACTVCGIEHTDHTYENGICTVCGYAHVHTIEAGITCETCGYTQEAQSKDGVLQVEITWTTMSFTYTAGEWDPATHGYSVGSWQATESGGGVITVENTGTVAANISFTFNPAMSGVGGSFTPNAVIVAPSATQTIQFMPTDKPTETFTDGTLGTISITVQAAPSTGGES